MIVSSYWATKVLRTAKYSFVELHFHLGDHLLDRKLPLKWRNPTKLVVDNMFLKYCKCSWWSHIK